MAITRTSGTFNFGAGTTDASGSPGKFLSDGDFIVLNSYGAGFGVDFSQTAEDKIAKITLYTNCTSGTVKETWYNDGSTWLNASSTADSNGIFEIFIPSSNTPPNVVAVRFNAANEIWWKMQVEYLDGEIEDNFRSVIFKGNKIGAPDVNSQQVFYSTSASNYLTISGADIDFGLDTDGDVGMLYLPRPLPTAVVNNQAIIAPAELKNGTNDTSVPVIQLSAVANYLFTNISSETGSWDITPTWNSLRLEANMSRYLRIEITRVSASNYLYYNSYSIDGVSWTKITQGTGHEATTAPFNPVGLIGIGYAQFLNQDPYYFRGYLDLATFKYEKNGVETWSACGAPTPVTTSNIYLGSANVSNIYLGADSVDKIYLGSELIFKN